MAVKIKPAGDAPLFLEVIERDEEVVLRAFGHDFCKVLTDNTGEHKIVVFDTDRRILLSQYIKSLAGSR